MKALAAGLVAMVLFGGLFGFAIGAVALLCMFNLPGAICCAALAFVMLGLIQWVQSRP